MRGDHFRPIAYRHEQGAALNHPRSRVDGRRCTMFPPLALFDPETIRVLAAVWEGVVAI
jgi:hypothetical protein